MTFNPWKVGGLFHLIRACNDLAAAPPVSV